MGAAHLSRATDRSPVPATETKGWLWLGAIGIAFVAAGATGYWQHALRPAVSAFRARNWTATTCRIERIRLAEKRGDDGTITWIEVAYSYTDADERRHEGNRYSFEGTYVGSTDRKLQIVDRLRRAGSAPCLYDPDDPARSVIDRGRMMIGAWDWAMLTGVAIGVFMIGYGLRMRRDARRPVIPWTRRDRPGEIVLRPRDGSLLPTLVSGSLTLIWLSVPAMYADLAEEIDFSIIAFPLLVLAATVASIYFVRNGLRLLGPRIRLSLPVAAIQLGERIGLGWRIGGISGAVDRLTLKLVGIEWAASGAGSDRTIEQHVFHTEKLFDGRPERTGTVTVAPPDHAMHTFRGENNQIIWRILLEAEVRSWPDLDQEMEIDVAPAEVPGA